MATLLVAVACGLFAWANISYTGRSLIASLLIACLALAAFIVTAMSKHQVASLLYIGACIGWMLLGEHSALSMVAGLLLFLGFAAASSRFAVS